MRKGIAVILTLSLLLALIGPTPKAEAAAQTEREAYIQRVLPGYLSAASIAGETICYTDEISIVDAVDETAELTFVLVDGHFVGYLNVYYYSNAFHSVFTEMTSESLELIMRNCEPFFLKAVENDVLLISENKTVALYNRYSERYNGPMASSEDNTYQLHVLHAADSGVSMRITGSVNVPTVTTNNNAETWAACVASVVNYYNSTSYTVSGVFNSLYSHYGGYPYCSDLWIERGYYFLGGLNCSHASTTYFETLQEEIGIYQRPVLLQFACGNVMVCKYFSEDSNGFYLGFMDPFGGFSGTTYQFQDYSFPSTLTYTIAGLGTFPLSRVHYKE